MDYYNILYPSGSGCINTTLEVCDVEKLPGNIKELFDFLNWFLILTQMVSLYLGVRKFRDVPLVGGWFRWKAFGYTLLVFGADLLALYFLWKGNPLFAAIRLTISRVIVLWETLYCFYFQFDRLPYAMQFVLTNPWIVDTSIKKYRSVTRRLGICRMLVCLKRYVGSLLNKMSRTQPD